MTIRVYLNARFVGTATDLGNGRMELDFDLMQLANVGESHLAIARLNDDGSVDRGVNLHCKGSEI